MENELTTLVCALRQITYEAGCALLDHADPGTVQHCTTRYNDVYGQLRTMAPAVAVGFKPLPADASPGSVRLAARDVATYVQQTLTGCHTAPLCA